MIQHHKLYGDIKQILETKIIKPQAFDFEVYDPRKHRVVIPQLYARCLHKPPLSSKWSEIDDFYGEGIQLVNSLNDGFYTAFIFSEIKNDKPYIHILGVMDEFRGKGIGRLLIQRVAANFAKMGYKKIYVELNAECKTFSRVYKELGFMEAAL